MLIESIVIVANSNGYTAHMRFTDSRLDEDVASTSKYLLYERIEKKIARKCHAGN